LHHTRQEVAIIRPIFAVACALIAVPALADTTLHLDQQAQKIVPRDRLAAELRVEATGPDSRAVQDEVNRRMGAALAKARKSSGLTVQRAAIRSIANSRKKAARTSGTPIRA